MVVVVVVATDVDGVVEAIAVMVGGGSASSPSGSLVLVFPAISSIEVGEQATDNKMLHKVISTIKLIKGDLTFLHFIFQLP